MKRTIDPRIKVGSRVCARKGVHALFSTGQVTSTWSDPEGGQWAQVGGEVMPLWKLKLASRRAR
jgi:hypothetical protein